MRCCIWFVVFVNYNWCKKVSLFDKKAFRNIIRNVVFYHGNLNKNFYIRKRSSYMRKWIFDRKFLKQISRRFLPILWIIFSLTIISLLALKIAWEKSGLEIKWLWYNNSRSELLSHDMSWDSEQIVWKFIYNT